ncbi:bacitracin ABC transporter ATP-binding protein [Falsibacillus pallidus]
MKKEKKPLLSDEFLDELANEINRPIDREDRSGEGDGSD